MIKTTANLENLSGSIFAMFRFIDILFILDIFFLLFISIKNLEKYKGFKRNIPSFVLLFFIPILYLIYAHYKVDILNKGYPNQMLFKRSWTQNQTMASLTPIGYHLFDFYNYHKDSKPYIMSTAEKEEVNNWINKKAEPLPNNKYKGILKDKNLILLQVESLENFVINLKIEGEEITPNLNNLLSNSLYFNNFYEQTHNGTTSDGELLANTSLYPLRIGSTFFRYPNNTYINSLPNIMERLGYKTLAVHPDKGSYWNWLNSLKSIGFDECYDASYFNMDEVIGLGLSDKSFLNQLIPLLKNQPEPFYSFSITLTSHSPFYMPEEHRKLNLPKSLDESRLGKYFQSIAYTDSQIGSFINSLEKIGLLDNSVLVIYGDHEGVHKFFSDEIEDTMDLYKLENNDLKVPFIIYSKDLNGEEISTIGGQVDMLPTLAYLMGAEKEDYMYTSFGRNLLNTNKNYVITSRGKYIGDDISEEDKLFYIKGLDYSDKIIRSNFFKE
ncbi:LTA synthase family protein [uncultured Clostridium sp.]|uniref:LTA synthase family protein n=1 Tax=uncultured Clostridium sp. TaxID=59620 RepID=UPI0028EC57CC|nr:LTA synthase family protein [uncultured Clostridium sp.]